MGAAALAVPAEPLAANDNDHGPTSRNPDLWRYVIDGLTQIKPSLGVYAAQCKLRGMDVHDFCDELTASIHRANEYDRQKALRRRRGARKLAIKRRRQAAKRRAA